MCFVLQVERFGIFAQRFIGDAKSRHQHRAVGHGKAILRAAKQFMQQACGNLRLALNGVGSSAQRGGIGQRRAVVFSVVALLMSIAYVAAKRGSLLGMLVYPPIFTSVTLSFFYAYFFALPIVLYPVLAAAYMLYRRTIIGRAQRLRAQALA